MGRTWHTGVATTAIRVAVLVLVVSSAPALRAQVCAPYWASMPGLPCSSCYPFSVAYLADPAGPAIYVCEGRFPLETVYRWQNGAWSDIGSTLPLLPNVSNAR